METNHRKGWALLTFLLFFLSLICLAAPANEKDDKLDSHTNTSMKLETEDKLIKANYDDGNGIFPDEQIIGHRTKRPARMLPHYILYGSIKNDTDEVLMVKEFYGPPTSCDDLTTLGYTLNGNYLVNGKDVPDNRHKIEMIACHFKKPPGLEGEGTKKEERFGILEVTSASSKINAASTSNGINITKEDIGRLINKRPARLIPFKFQFHGKEKNVEDKEFYGPASNCTELQQLGYTLNGYYLLQGKERAIDSELEIAYCQFKLKKSARSKNGVSSKIGELRLGFINISPLGINTDVDKLKNSRQARSINTFTDQLFKRPARLLPLRIILGEETNITKTSRFTGPAYNCDDLGKVGYTLNGYYVVDSHENSSNGRKEVLFCRFRQSLLGEQVKKEQRLGFIGKAALPTHAKGFALTTKDDADSISGEKSFCTIKTSLSSIVSPRPSLGVISYSAGSLSSSSRNSGPTHAGGGNDVRNETCYLLLKFSPSQTFLPRFLGIKDYSEGKPIRSGPMLINRKASDTGTQGDSIWVQRDMHLCSFVVELCLSLHSLIINGTIKKEYAVTLVPYNETDPYQKWEIKSKLQEISEIVIINPETKLCLTYNSISVSKEMQVKPCELQLDQGWHFSLFQDTPENRQLILKIINSSFKVI